MSDKNIRLSEKQKKEIENLIKYIPTNCHWQEKNNADIKKFFEWSEKGLHKKDALIKTYLVEGRTYFHALVWAKKWRERHYKGLLNFF